MGGVVGLEHVEPHWSVLVGRVEVNDVFDSFFRDVFQTVLDEVSVGINDAAAVALFDILPCHVADQS